MVVVTIIDPEHIERHRDIDVIHALNLVEMESSGIVFIQLFISMYEFYTIIFENHFI